MRLSRRNEVLLDAEMDLQISTFELAATPRGELWRLHLFIEAEDPMEGSRLVFATGEHRNQNVNDTANWHLV